MFYNRFLGEEIGRWQGRTVWLTARELPWSVWGGLIKGVVPIMFYTDFASVPRHFHMYDLFGGKCNREAASHDYVYREDSVVLVSKPKLSKDVPEDVAEWVNKVGSGTYQGPPRFIGDNIFKRLMIESGEPAELYEPMFLAVRVGGEGSYHKFKVQDKLPCDTIVSVG